MSKILFAPALKTKTAMQRHLSKAQPFSRLMQNNHEEPADIKLLSLVSFLGGNGAQHSFADLSQVGVKFRIHCVNQVSDGVPQDKNSRWSIADWLVQLQFIYSCFSCMLLLTSNTATSTKGKSLNTLSLHYVILNAT